jgi:hypothetical protein
MPYFFVCFTLVVAVLAVESPRFGPHRYYFVGYMFLTALLQFERSGFTELLASKDREIEKMKRSDSQPPT